MIPKIAIHGREKQPNLVIKYLEKLGGINETNWRGDDIKGFYWIDELKRIRCTNYIPQGYQFLDDWYKKDNKSTKTKYILVHYPESQYFTKIEDCYSVYPSINDTENLDKAIFVPEDIYNKMTNNE